ncbi:hypothetical protein MOQ_009877 [Trypanosoma cruzi marinkellei]|uniref:Uncharacterized protein n=1 Tax=Trypanosoma cruzi marinkellei TaxID=85056 RepID=K2NBJ6_TRYCR|nr:hypothetical protein MOQ_009877 [Trypanosoma cruzi marinkellei]
MWHVCYALRMCVCVCMGFLSPFLHIYIHIYIYVLWRVEVGVGLFACMALVVSSCSLYFLLFLFVCLFAFSIQQCGRMPPPKKSVVLRHRAHMIASSVDDQEAALMEWRARAQQGKETLQRIRSKIDAHKKLAETTKRGGRWLVEWTSLQREAVSCDLELSKAYAACAHLLPQSLRNELAKQEEQKVELLGDLSERVMRIRKELERLQEQKNQPSQEALRTLSESISALRKELREKKKATDVEAEKMMRGEANGETDQQQSPMETLQKSIQSTMKTFDGICESIDGKINAALVETYRNALQTEGENTTSQAAAATDRRVGTVVQSQNDLRTVSLILKTYDSEVESGTTAAAISEELYDRVQRALPHLSKMSARRVVDEALRQKRERVYMRSVILQYKKRSTELLESFKKAVMAEEEIMKMRNAIREETRMREERQQKAQEELERLRVIREAKDASRRAEEEAKKAEEDEKHQKLLCVREAEFQERLRRLKEYQEEQRELQEKERVIQQALAEENALKKAIQKEHNAKRVEERKKEYEEKCRSRRKHQEEMEELRKAHQKTLETFFKGIERRLGVTCDAERVLQPTTSSQQSVPFVSFSEASQFTLHGYTVDDVMKDPRFRLQLALMEAGLHQTPYGREVISRGYHVPAAQRPSEDNPLRMEY